MKDSVSDMEVNRMVSVDDTAVKEGVEEDTVNAVRELSTYKYGWEIDIEMEYAPKGLTPF